MKWKVKMWGSCGSLCQADRYDVYYIFPFLILVEYRHDDIALFNRLGQLLPIFIYWCYRRVPWCSLSQAHIDTLVKVYWKETWGETTFCTCFHYVRTCIFSSMRRYWARGRKLVLIPLSTDTIQTLIWINTKRILRIPYWYITNGLRNSTKPPVGDPYLIENLKIGCNTAADIKLRSIVANQLDTTAESWKNGNLFSSFFLTLGVAGVLYNDKFCIKTRGLTASFLTVA